MSENQNKQTNKLEIPKQSKKQVHTHTHTSMESVLYWPTTPRHRVCPEVLLIINLRNTAQLIIQYMTMKKK